MKSKVFAILVCSVFLYQCMSDPLPPNFQDSVTVIEASEQRAFGDPNAGKDYLIYGDYISSGFPYDFFIENFGVGEDNLLAREGKSASVPYSFNVVTAENGVDIVAPNCFQCHAASLDGELILGLGNYASDYTFNQSAVLTFSEQAILSRYGSDSPEYEAFEPFLRASKKTAPHLVTEVKGVNPADKLTAVLAAHRDPQSLQWVDDPLYEIPEGLIPTDVPPLWLAKKKNALYYTGSGRGDHARLMTLAEILTMPDTTKAKEVDESFEDVYTYIRNIEPPKYPEVIDQQMAMEGEMLFIDHCSKCHGTTTYPNILVDLDYIGTDPELAKANFGYEAFLEWYNNSWYSKGDYPAYFEKTVGYIAPPLDGVWATAPYLHNGSVPDLESLLNSALRPDFWKRNEQYNLEKVGWEYTSFDDSAGTSIYNTKIMGYSNEGHLFGDMLVDDERKKIIEYLKTL